MPTYEFLCECGNAFEREFKMTDKHLALCDCGKLAKKVYQVIATHFKGTGWGKD